MSEVSDKAKQQLEKGGDLAKIARAAVSAGGRQGAVGAAMAMMGFGGGDEAGPEKAILAATGIDVAASGEQEIVKNLARRLALPANPRKAPDRGADYAVMVNSFAQLLHPEDTARREEAAAKIRGVFQQMTDLDDPQSFNTAYTDFGNLAKGGKAGWKEARTESYKRFVPFAAEVAAINACCRQAVTAGFLSDHDTLARSAAAWDRDVGKLLEALRTTGKNAQQDAIAPPVETVIGTVIAQATPFTEREKPKPQTAAGKVIAAKVQPKGPDLTALKALLDGPELKDKTAITQFVDALGSEDVLKSSQRRTHADELKREASALRQEVQKVESGNFPNLGALTKSLEVLHTHAGRLLGTVREKLRDMYEFPVNEALPDDTGIALINSTIALEKITAALGEQKKALAGGLAKTD